MSPVLDQAEIRALLPQRYPILLVDRVLELVTGERIVAEKAVSACEPCFEGLDGTGIGADRFAFPRPLLIESWGQAGGVLWAATRAAASRPGPEDGLPILAILRDCLFSREVVPGEVVRLEVRIDQVVGPNVFLTGTASVGDELVLTMASALAALRPPAALGEHAT